MDSWALAAHGLALDTSDRTIDHDNLSEWSCVFPWPEDGNEQRVIVCSYPDCWYPEFKQHPLRKNRGVEHFATHGIFIDEPELITLLSYRVLNYSPGPDMSYDEAAINNVMSQRKEKDKIVGPPSFPLLRLLRCQRPRALSCRERRERHHTQLASLLPPSCQPGP